MASTMLDAALATAPFLQRHLERHPDWREELEADDLSRPRDERDLRARTDRVIASMDDPTAALRQVLEHLLNQPWAEE